MVLTSYPEPLKTLEAMVMLPERAIPEKEGAERVAQMRRILAIRLELGGVRGILQRSEQTMAAHQADISQAIQQGLANNEQKASAALAHHKNER